jgi:rubrerythrin
MSALKSDLRHDLAGESKAIKDYGIRKREAKGTGVVSDLSEIQNDEKDHHKILTKAINGLKACAPGSGHCK